MTQRKGGKDEPTCFRSIPAIPESQPIPPHAGRACNADDPRNPPWRGGILGRGVRRDNADLASLKKPTNKPKNMTTQHLPVDKHGNVYYGPRTFREATIQIFGENGESLTKRETLDFADNIESAGYSGVAARVRKMAREWRA